LQPRLGVDVYPTVRLEGLADVGFLRSCGKNTYIDGVGVRGSYRPSPWGMSLAYYFGVEAERPVLPGQLSSTDPCPSENSPLPSDMVALIQTRSHTGAGMFHFMVNRDLEVRAGYSLQSRFAGDYIHGLLFAIRHWW
jgi:hypothetical protein